MNHHGLRPSDIGRCEKGKETLRKWVQTPWGLPT